MYDGYKFLTEYIFCKYCLLFCGFYLFPDGILWSTNVFSFYIIFSHCTAWGSSYSYMYKFFPRPFVLLQYEYPDIVLNAIQPQQHRIWAVSATYSTAHGNARSLTHRARPGNEPATPWFLVGFVNHCTTTETPGVILIFSYHQLCQATVITAEQVLLLPLLPSSSPTV